MKDDHHELSDTQADRLQEELADNMEHVRRIVDKLHKRLAQFGYEMVTVIGYTDPLSMSSAWAVVSEAPCYAETGLLRLALKESEG